jgi:hypothetical protein
MHVGGEVVLVGGWSTETTAVSEIGLKLPESHIQHPIKLMPVVLKGPRWRATRGSGFAIAALQSNFKVDAHQSSLPGSRAGAGYLWRTTHYWRIAYSCLPCCLIPQNLRP